MLYVPGFEPPKLPATETLTSQPKHRVVVGSGLLRITTRLWGLSLGCGLTVVLCVLLSTMYTVCYGVYGGDVVQGGKEGAVVYDSKKRPAGVWTGANENGFWRLRRLLWYMFLCSYKTRFGGFVACGISDRLFPSRTTQVLELS